jgi:hypothetical protein
VLAKARLPLRAAPRNDTRRDFCDPKKLGECQGKIDNLITSLDAFRAKLVKARTEIQGGKKLTNQEADRMIKKMGEIHKLLPGTEGNLWDY